MTMKIRMLSAHNPMTGARHLGHYVSTMKEWVQQQSKYECFFVVDDIIANIVYPIDREKVQNRALYTFRDFLASGLNPNQSHFVLASMVPEYLEIMMLMSTVIDVAYVQRLHSESFCGTIKSYHRKQLGMSMYTSVAELLYPQLALPAFTVGLDTHLFQGGEEISGYTYIMDEVVKKYNDTYGKVLRAPELLKPKTPFLIGTDGVHMITDNAIILSWDEKTLAAAVERVQKPRVFHEWYSAMDHEAKAQEMATRTELTSKDRQEMTAVLNEQLTPFRSYRITNGEILAILRDGAKVARARFRDTIDKMRSAQSIARFS
jgi:tryptophanyl-tRNA synthetase